MTPGIRADLATSKRALLLIGLLVASFQWHAGAQVYTITIRCSVIAMPKDQALQFISGNPLGSNPAAALKKLLKMVENKRAQSVANAAVSTKSGQKATSESAATKLEVEPVLGPDGDLIDLNIEFGHLEKKISTSVTVRNGGVKFLGAYDVPGVKGDFTYLTFVFATATE